MMTERQRLLYVSEKKSWAVALLAAALFGPFGLFYSKYVVIPLILIFMSMTRICAMIEAIFVADPDKFINGLIAFTCVWIASLILAPILVAFHNKKLRETVAPTKKKSDLYNIKRNRQ